MKIVVAPDSFKGSLSARDICLKVEEGIRRVMPEASVVKIPLADGGEGTMENMVYATCGVKRKIEVKGPNGKKVAAEYGILGDCKTVVIEMAQASGLPLLQDDEKDPSKTTSFGTGELILDALNQGYRKFIIGLGGSATNDAGMGMLRALGMKFYDKEGLELPEGGLSLLDLDYFSDTALDPRLSESSFIVASDVRNKLCGHEGASMVFGPQKGASPSMVKALDQALYHFAEIVLEQKGQDMRLVEGGGAAGGLGAALSTFLKADIQSGIHVMMKTLNMENELKNAQLLITGEGRLDSQTLSGKVINGVSQLAQLHRVPVIALCGSIELEAGKFDELGILSAFSIVPGPCPLDDAIDNAAKWIPERVEAIMRVVEYSLI